MSRFSLIVLSVFLVLLSSAASGADHTEWMEGVWSGQGSQSNGSSWGIKLTVERQGVGHYYKIEYPSLGCTGYWTLNSASALIIGGTASFREHIIDGRDKCVNDGTISVTSQQPRSGAHVQTMDYSWTGIQPGGQLDNASASLDKWGEGSPPPAPFNGNLQDPNAGRMIRVPLPAR